MNLTRAKTPAYGHPDIAGRTILRRGHATGDEYSLKDRISGFIELIRPVFFILTPVNAASAAVLASGGYPTLAKCVLGFGAVAFASCAINVFNDYADRERDKQIWPNRPLPSGRIKPNEALLVAAVSIGISLSLAWFFFNPLTFYILLLAVILGALYSVYLRNNAGYLSLPPIVGLIYLGGWAAFSPETLFHSWLPWYLYLLGVVWQTAHIMVYYPLHLIPNTDTEPKEKAPKALFFTPSPRVAVEIGTGFTCLTLILSILLFFLAPLSVAYLVLVIAAGTYALYHGLKLRKDASNRERGLKAFVSLSIFRLAISAAVLLSVFLAQMRWL